MILYMGDCEKFAFHNCTVKNSHSGALKSVWKFPTPQVHLSEMFTKFHLQMKSLIETIKNHKILAKSNVISIFYNFK